MVFSQAKRLGGRLKFNASMLLTIVSVTFLSELLKLMYVNHPQHKIRNITLSAVAILTLVTLVLCKN
jgi:predicted neutral ceramidase superfamily lipid hydrolase